MSQSPLHPINDILSNLFTFRLKQKVVQETFIKFNVLKLGRCLVIQILRSQWISDPISSSMKDEEWDCDGTEVASQIRGDAQNLMPSTNSYRSHIDQRVRVLGQESGRIPRNWNSPFVSTFELEPWNHQGENWCDSLNIKIVE